MSCMCTYCIRKINEHDRKGSLTQSKLTKLPVKETEKASEHTKMVCAPKIFSQGERVELRVVLVVERKVACNN